MVSLIRLCILVACLAGSLAHAKGSRGVVGVNVATGFPFLSQVGANVYLTDNIGVDLGYGIFSISSGDAELSLTMPEVLLKWHPFSGSFFIAGGMGQETLTSKASDATTNQSAEIKITAMTTIAKVGWMWGSSDGGFWFGMDAAYVSPSGAKTKVTSALPPTNQAYIDAYEAGEKFGKTTYTSLTFARFGWLF